MKLGFDKILVPIDFSETSISALDYAITIASELDSELILLHVVESYEFNSAYRNKDISADIITKGLEAKMREVAQERGAGSNLKLKFEHRVGKIYKMINQTVKDFNIDLVIMGTHGATGITEFGKYIMGTNAYRVVQMCSCPVITIKEKIHEGRFENILLPLDLTKATKKKVETGIEFAKMFSSNMHVLAVSTFFNEFTDHVPKLKKDLDEVVSEIKSEGITCYSDVETHENPAHAVLTYAEKNDIDLIIIMTKQEKRWDELFVGSSAKRIISASKIPVLSLKTITKPEEDIVNVNLKKVEQE